MTERIALVTGASRGIGKATALLLAEAGFDVALTARTLHPGERYEHSSTVKASDTSAMPGSLTETAQAVEARGRRALAVRMDLLDSASIDAAAAEVEKGFGRVDVLVNNAVYTGPGNMDRVLDLPLEVVERTLLANVVAQLQLTQRILPGMLARREGVVVNVVSAAGLSDPPAPAGAGGWSFAYGASKAALHRMAGVLAVEHADSGVRFYNLEPGFVTTEMMQLQHRGTGLQHMRGAPPRVPATVITWLATAAEAAELDDLTVHAQPFCKRRGLLPDWP